MLCAPPESMTSASPRRMISVASPTAWLLAAQAVRQLKFGPSAPNCVATYAAGMLGSCSSSSCGSSRLQPFLDERAQVELAVLEGGHHHVAEVVKVLLAFAGAEIHAEAVGVDRADDARVVHRLLGRADGEPRVPAALFPGGRVFADVGDRPIANLGRDARGKVAGVEQRRVIDAGAAFLQIGPQLGHRGAERRDAAHAGYYNTSSHGEYLFKSRNSPQRTQRARRRATDGSMSNRNRVGTCNSASAICSTVQMLCLLVLSVSSVVNCSDLSM